MGAAKSKPKELGQRSRSLDDGTGGHHHSPNQSSFTPNRSPPVDGTRRGTQPNIISAEQALFGGVNSNNSTTSPHRIGTLSGNAARSDQCPYTSAFADFQYYSVNGFGPRHLKGELAEQLHHFVQENMHLIHYSDHLMYAAHKNSAEFSKLLSSDLIGRHAKISELLQ